MYIPEFWCGVIAAILVEIAVVIASSLCFGRNHTDETNEE